MLELARAAGVEIFPHAQPEEQRRAIETADLVHLQFWNTPETYAWLRASQPEMRLIVTMHVAGEYPSQVISQTLLEFADWIVPTTAYSLELPAFQALDAARAARLRVILPASPKPPEAILAPPHTRIRVGYAGTVDFVKLHPQFIGLCAQVESPQVEFAMVGGGADFKMLRRQADAAGIGARFDWLGYRNDIFPVMATFDLLGYPLRRDAYATSDLILQEAMWLGVPPVILGYGALPYLVQDGVTGIVARDESEYVRAVQFLCDNEHERTRLGANARAYAHEHFGTEKSALQLGALYAGAMEHPKQNRTWSTLKHAAGFEGAWNLIESFGSFAHEYIASVEAKERAATFEAEGKIAYASPVAVNAGGGGILDYRRAYPNDAMLRLWAGLVLGQQGRFALAAGEFYAAARLGLDDTRTRRYLERVMGHERPVGEDIGL
jgi:Glycosyl transferases group 1